MNKILLHALPYMALAQTIFWLLWVVVTFSNAGVSMLDMMLGYYGCIALAAFWSIRLIIFTIIGSQVKARYLSKRPWMVGLSIEPIVLLLGFLVMNTSSLFHARFEMSRPALDRYAHRVQAGGISPTSCEIRWVGFFRIRETELIETRVVRLITTDCGMDHCGLAYSEGSKPPRIGEDSYTHLSGPWWHWHRSW